MEGITKEQKKAISLAAARRRRSLAQEMSHPENQDNPKLTGVEKVATNPLTRFAVSAGEPIVNLSEFIMRSTGIQGEEDQPGILTKSLQDYKDIVKGAEDKLQPHQVIAGKIADVGGNVASPLYWSAPGLRGAAPTIPGRILQGGEAGFLAGAAQEVDPNQSYLDQKITQLGFGLAGGLAGSSVIEATRAGLGFAGNLLKPLTRHGRATDIDDSLRNLATESVDDIVPMLRNARPGQTSSQAIAAGNRQSGKVVGGPLVSLEKDLSRKNPVSDRIQSIYKKQRLSRLKSIDSIAGTDANLKRAYQARKAATEKLYKIVEKSKKTVSVVRVSKAINGYASREPADKNLVTALNEISTGLKNPTPGALHSLSKRIKAMMESKTPGGQQEFNVQVLSHVKDILDDQIGRAEPAYRRARSLYKKLSRPINKMEVGRELKDALVNAKEGETAATFMNAIRNSPRTIKRSTGFSRYDDMSQVLDPADIKKINKISDELLTSEEAARMARNAVTTADNLTDEAARLPALLKREVVIANHVLKKLSDRDVGESYQKILLNRFTDPQKLAEVLSKPAGHPLRRKVVDNLVRAGIVSSPEILNQALLAVDVSLVNGKDE